MPRDLGTVNPREFYVFDYNAVIEFYMKTIFRGKNVVFIRWDEVPPRDGEHNWVWHLFWDHSDADMDRINAWKANGGHGQIPFTTWFHPDMTQLIEFKTVEEAVEVANNFPEEHDKDPSGGWGYAEAWINGEVVTHNT
jgi:hypothetical protein